ncbi:aldo/keto reductase [Geomesophilobacter sediminis]|uniref:Aldo/keto reductase n=1 Tax=Geomesophilobacter sediminis TaxID=2798584 RepID=A0A8J7IZP3_9BACT|nr:aldo/keto reductase [Geomesophilobacter sediminis]MBJ6725582.1 aldo/keto reductase [Geomesophilobacter sediminis]
MSRREQGSGMNRRKFLKLGLVGTTSTVLATRVLADAAMAYAQERPEAFTFPAPVYRTLGRTGMKVCIVGFGAMLTPEPEVMRIAFEHGVNYVNTSRKYMSGKNEEIVGRALKGLRDKVYVATKIQTEVNTKEAIMRDVEASLKALQTDYIDVIQLDANADPKRIFRPEPREAFETLKRQGKVRFFGAAVHKDPAGVVNALADDRTRFFDTVLVAYNFKSDPAVGKAIARAAQTGMGVVAMKTQAGGYAVSALGSLSPHQAALKWALEDPHVALAVPGMRDLTELRHDIAVMGLPLTAADRRTLAAYGAAVEARFCRLCGSCEGGCPRGVEIGTVNRALMYAEGYREPALAAATYRELPRTASASTCLDCAGCVARCAKGLDIAANMQRAHRIFG